MTSPTTFVQAVEMAMVGEENNSKAIGEKKDGKRKWDGPIKLVKKPKIRSVQLRPVKRKSLFLIVASVAEDTEESLEREVSRVTGVGNLGILCGSVQNQSLVTSVEKQGI